MACEWEERERRVKEHIFTDTGQRGERWCGCVREYLLVGQDLGQVYVEGGLGGGRGEGGRARRIEWEERWTHVDVWWWNGGINGEENTEDG